MEIVITVIAVLLAFMIGRKTAPVPSAPEPKSFGLNEAELVKEKLGGLNPLQAQAAQVAALVGGMEYVLPKQVSQERAALAAAVANEQKRIEALKAEIGRAQNRVVGNQARDFEVSEVAAAFGV